MSGAFGAAWRGEPVGVPPVWMMRQAGRYQASYRAMRERHSFEALCRDPELASRLSLGAVQEFDFDAAILFSDLLFPLEALGFGLSYDFGPPALDGSLSDARIARFRPLDEAIGRLAFQRDAMAATRAGLPAGKGLLGFVGGPWTLFVYAVEGTHAGALARAKASPALYRAFADRVVPLLEANIRLQFDGGADAVMVFDTAAGELSPEMFDAWTSRDLAALAGAFPGRLGYYARGFRPAHVEAPAFAAAAWGGLGIDSAWDLASALASHPAGRVVQGNFDPAALLRTGRDLDRLIEAFLSPLRALPAEARRGWVCGLGHGVLPGTPEASVRRFVTRVRETFS